jgi:hypothetical protein
LAQHLHRPLPLLLRLPCLLLRLCRWQQPSRPRLPAALAHPALWCVSSARCCCLLLARCVLDGILAAA